MGIMFEEFKGHRVTRGSTPTPGRDVVTKSKLQDLLAKKRRAAKAQQPATDEQGGPEGPEPTRYGDWEVGGRVSDF